MQGSDCVFKKKKKAKVVKGAGEWPPYPERPAVAQVRASWSRFCCCCVTVC